MESAYKQDGFIKTISKWTALAVCIYLCASSLNTFHNNQVQKITASNEVMMQKSFLITQMHNEMLSITRMQLQILHASNDKEAKKLLWDLSSLVSDYLIHFHQLEGIAESSDVLLLTEFRAGFDKWYRFNKDLLNYANVVADTGFINTLSMIDLAFSQFDSDTEESLQLIAQLKRDIGYEKVLSN